MNVASGFFVGKADLQRKALIGKKEFNGVIETFRILGVIARRKPEAILTIGFSRSNSRLLRRVKPSSQRHGKRKR
jgi:hypothetical protein